VDGGPCLTTPLGTAGTVLPRLVVDEAIAGRSPGPGAGRGATGAGTLAHAWHPLRGAAMAPLAQRGRGKVPRLRDGVQAMPGDDLADRWGTPEHAGLLGLLEEGIPGGERLIGTVAFEGPPRGEL
jgi:hypothetical protein